MSNTLEQIKKEITSVIVRYEKLGQEIQDLNTLLVSRRTEFSKAIANEQDPGELGDEIVKLQTRLRGAQGAHEILTEELRKLQKKKALEERTVHLEKAHTVGSEAIIMAEDVYLAFVDLIEKFCTFKAKATEFRGSMKIDRAYDQLRHRADSMIFCGQAIEKEIPPLLDRFPKQLFDNENLPKPDELKKKLRARVKHKSFETLSHGNLEAPQSYRPKR